MSGVTEQYSDNRQTVLREKKGGGPWTPSPQVFCEVVVEKACSNPGVPSCL